MGTTKLAYLKKIQDGVAFSEGFENPNFLTAEGWVTVKGQPANATVRAFQGIESWDNSANGQSIPIARRDFGIQEIGPTFMATVWFYDDPSEYTEQGPYFKIKCTDGSLMYPTISYFQVGVRNGIDTGHYVCNAAATFAEDNFAVTTKARSSGWHRFDIISATSPYGNTVGIYIDMVQVGSFTKTPLYLSSVYLCSNTVAGTGNSFGYFDTLFIFKNSMVDTIYSSSLNWYDGNNNFLETAAGLDQSQFGLIGFPYYGYMEVPQDSTRKTVLCRSPLTAFYPGDIYQIVSVDFGRKVTGYKPTGAALANTHQSTSGVTETLFNAYKNKYTFGVNLLEGLPIKGQLNNFFNFAVQGFPFSMLLDSDNSGFGLMSAAPTVGSNTVTIMPNLGTNPTDAFTVGRQYLLFNAENTYRQQVTLQSKSTTQLTFAENILEPFSALDYVCEATLYPFLELGDNPDGLVMVDEKYFRFNWLQNCQDYNEA